MASRLTISAEWERLDEGAAEERACFAAIGIDVSPLVVRTLLVNHGRLDRAELEEDQTSVDEDQVLVAAAARPAPR